MVAYVLDENLRHVRTIKLWRGDFDSAAPFDAGDDTLFVAYSAWAEMTCFLTLGWKLPEHIFDLHTAYLAASNVLLTQDRRRLSRYMRRWLGERFFAWIQWQRRILVRWEYYARNFLGFVQLACLVVLFRRF